MRLTLIVLPLVLAMLAGCATTSLPLAALPEVPAERVQWRAPAGAAATLVVARDSGFSGSALVVKVMVDGAPAGDLAGAERLSLPVAPGRRVVTASAHFSGTETRRPRSVEVTIESGHQAVVRVGFDDGAQGIAVWQDLTKP